MGPLSDCEPKGHIHPMETSTFDSPAPPAFWGIYARRSQDRTATLATSFEAAVSGNNTATSATSSQAAIPRDMGGVQRTLNEVMFLWTQAYSDVGNASIFCDALKFVGAMPVSVLQPRVWADDTEVVFEWISGDRHAIVSCEGDGMIGYTYRVAGQFVPGLVTAARSDGFPTDLAAYLA